MNKINSFVGFGILIGVLMLTACGGGGSSSGGAAPQSGSDLTGVFIDSSVQGLGYSTETQSGVTNVNGEFHYRAGEQVTFFVGGIEIGKATGADVMTPVSLVAGAVDETNEVVTRISRFMQTIDDDGNPDNGIDIPESVSSAALEDSINFQSANFDIDTVDLVSKYTALTAAGERGLVDASVARAHLQANLYLQLGGLYSGTYSGTADFGAGEQSWSGTWEMNIDGSGNVSALSTDQEGGTESFSGQLSSNGAGALGASSSGSSFSLAIHPDGTVSGTWKIADNQDPTVSGNGTLIGAKEQSQGAGSSPMVPGSGGAGTGESIWPPANVYPVTFLNSTDEVVQYDNPAIVVAGDQDWWSFSGKDYTFFFFVKTGANQQADDNTDMACIADVFDKDGNLKYSIDPILFISADTGFHKNCELIFTPPDSGTYYLRVRASDAYTAKAGPYTLVATRDMHTQYSAATNHRKAIWWKGRY